MTPVAAAVAMLLSCAGALVAGGASAAAAGGASRCPGAHLHPSATDARAVATATLCLVNRVRAAHGLRALRVNAQLDGVAASQVSSMVREDWFADDRPSGQTPLSLVARTRYAAHAPGFSVGQNIAWGTGSDATPAHIVAEWLASAPHREVLLGDAYRDAGAGVKPAVPAMLRSRGHGATYVIELGARS
jgi:uncharacterized protein YkwD